MAKKFILVKASQRIANRYQVKGAPALVFVDPDGQVIHRASVATGASAVSKALEAASSKYAPKSVSWGSEIGVAAGKKLLVVGFDAGEGETLKLFEEPALAKYHDKLGFVRFDYERGSELAKKWKVFKAPTILICDPTHEDPAKKPLAKLQGKKKLVSVRLAILKALAKIEAKK